jgi:hypothetical protein
MNLQAFANGKDINDVLEPLGLEVDVLTQGLANQAVKNIRFMMTMNFMTQEEGQAVFNRVVAMIGQRMKEV